MLKQSATGMSYTVGVAAGSVAAVAGEYIANTATVSKAPMLIRRALAPAFAVAAGGAMYGFGKKKNKARAYGHLAGAATGGLLWFLYGTLRDNFPSLQSPAGLQRTLQGWQDPTYGSYMTPAGMGSYMTPGPYGDYGSLMTGSQQNLDALVNDAMTRDSHPEATQMLAGFVQ